MRDSLIPLSLVTGFLGSGKTTLLQRVIERNSRRRLAYVVNEFGDADVDGQLLELGEDQMVCIPGGSIFCRCVSGDFIRALERLPDHFDDPDWPLQGVVVEASGIADPKVIAKMLEEYRLDRVYELRTIVNVIDPASFLKLVDVLPNVVSQVEACDVAVVNKTDLHDEASLRRVEEKIERINPHAEIVRSEYCQSEIDILASPPRRSLEGEYALCRDPNYETATVYLEVPLDPEPLLAELRRVGDELYRVKGFVPVPGGTIYLDVAAGRLSTRQVTASADGSRSAEPGQSGRLVFIFPPRAREEVDGIIAKLRSAV